MDEIETARRRPRYNQSVFLVLSKTFDVLFAPLTWALLLFIFAALLRRRPRISGTLFLLALGLLVTFSSDQAADRLMGVAENSAVRTERPDITYDAVIVLAGFIDSRPGRSTGRAQVNQSIDRLLYGWEVVRTGRARYILFSGGPVDPAQGQESEAFLAGRLLVEWGLPLEAIVIESVSRNTRESAVESTRTVRQHGWTNVLLVTSALHMERALGCFHAAGMSPDTRPVDYHGGNGNGSAWLPRSGALDKSTDALREMAGRIIYRTLGYQDVAAPKAATKAGR